MSTSSNYQYETVKVQVFPNGVAHVQLNREKVCKTGARGESRRKKPKK